MPSTVYIVVAGLQLLAAGVFLWLSAYDARFVWWALFAVVAAAIPVVLEMWT